MSEQLVQWVAPAPAWNEAARLNGQALTAFRQPVILRFTSDAFMDELFAVLETDPAALGLRRAVWETWRDPAPDPPLPERPSALLGGRFARGRNGSTPGTSALSIRPNRPLKLFQPAHGRYYLIATCLVCRLPGLPDRVVDVGEEERVTFVVRRLRAGIDTEDEYALVTEGGLTGWRRVGPADFAAEVVLQGEEKLPLSPLSYTGEDGRSRRLWTGLVPTGKREAYAGAPELPANDATPSTGTTVSPQPNAALLLFQRLVSGPWLSLIDIASTAKRTMNPGGSDRLPTASEQVQFIRESRENLQTGSWYVLLDFAQFLQEQLPEVWAAIAAQTGPALSSSQQALLDKLGAIKLPLALANDLTEPVSPAVTSAYGSGDIWGSLRAALAGIGAFADDLEAIEAPYDRTTRPNPAASEPQWPGFLFPLADPLHTDVATAQAEVTSLEALVAAALPEKPAGPTPATPLGAQAPLDPRGTDRFVIRCVFERPRCAPVTPPLVSLPSEPFLLAGFFDPEAPARPIRIALPIDISPAALRKYDKNTVLMLSDALCGQFDRLKALSLGDLIRSVLPWPLHKDLSVPAKGPCPDCLGLAISISLPIITICALILLLVIVALLDIIFHWLPYFIFVFPIKLFCAKVKI